MTLEELKKKLMKKAVIFQTGGFRPTNELGESWIGAVKWKLPGEELPTDADGEEMLPLASIFTGYLDYVPEEISGIKLINVFVSKNYQRNLLDLNGYYSIRAYDSVEELVPCDWTCEGLKSFPLKPELVDDDMPQWDGGMDPDLEDAVIELENSDGIEYYEDLHTKDYSMHKVGGYPAYIQSGDWDKSFEFVLQISSDDKVGLNIVDAGSFYFFYCKDADDWDIQCDFF
ncbi:MAG: DUF1963 domain-containing protein [Clostridiales bacterium]|nr:DUF1963 domain-containing protein [Clostridiales bacterium]